MVKTCDDELNKKQFLKACAVLQYQKCPGCAQMVERIDGCYHMKCPCKTHFLLQLCYKINY